MEKSTSDLTGTSSYNSKASGEKNAIEKSLEKQSSRTKEEKQLNAIETDVTSVRKNKSMSEQVASVDKIAQIGQSMSDFANNEKKQKKDETQNRMAANFVTQCQEVKKKNDEELKTDTDIDADAVIYISNDVVATHKINANSVLPSFGLSDKAERNVLGNKRSSDSYYANKKAEDRDRRLFEACLIAGKKKIIANERSLPDSYETNKTKDYETKKKKRTYTVAGTVAATYTAHKFAVRIAKKYNKTAVKKLKPVRGPKAVHIIMNTKPVRYGRKTAKVAGKTAYKSTETVVVIGKEFKNAMDAAEKLATEKNDNAALLLKTGLDIKSKVNDKAKRIIAEKSTDRKVKKLNEKAIKKINTNKQSTGDNLLKNKAELSQISHGKSKTGNPLSADDREKIENKLGIRKKGNKDIKAGKEKTKDMSKKSAKGLKKDSKTLKKYEKKIKKVTGAKLDKKMQRISVNSQMRSQARNYVINQIATEEGADLGALGMELMKTKASSMASSMAKKAGRGLMKATQNIFRIALKHMIRIALSLVSAIGLPAIIVVILIVVILGGVCGSVSADEEQNQQTTDININDLTGSTEQKIWVYLKSQNLSDITVAALMGNLQQESGLDPRSGENETHMGIVSWDKDGRFAALQGYAKQQNKDCWDLDVQLDYMMKELNGNGWIDEKAKLSVLKSCEKIDHLEYKSESDYGAVWCIARYYEICTSDTQKYGVQDYDKRLNFAQKFYDAFAGKDLDTLKPATNDLNQSKWANKDKQNVNSVTLTDVTKYACQFIGNKYVWGGTSLTDGCDCSGFTMKVYEKFGVTLPHSSAAQASCGTKVNGIKNAKPGDLFFYANGSNIHHVAIYLGNNLIVHAWNSKAYPAGGITTTPANYSPVYKICRPK